MSGQSAIASGEQGIAPRSRAGVQRLAPPWTGGRFTLNPVGYPV